MVRAERAGERTHHLKKYTALSAAVMKIYEQPGNKMQ
jgi:hypothetical protein